MSVSLPCLPLAVQQTVQDVEMHYVSMQKQISRLKQENSDLTRQLNAGRKARDSHSTEPMPGEVMTCNWNDISKDADDPGDISGGKNGKRWSELTEIVANGDGKSHNRFTATLSISKINQLRNDPFEDESNTPEQLNGSILSACSVKSMMNFVVLDDPELGIMRRITNAMLFKLLTPLAIAANTLYLGIAADVRVRNAFGRIHDMPQEDEPASPGIIFTAWFSLELCLKLLAEGKDFILGEDQFWNIFDSLLVLESIIDLSFSGAGLKLSFLRIFRVFRLVRVVRMVKSVNALAKLRTMIFAILNTFIDLCWAFLVIFLILFIFGMTFTTLVASYLDGVDLRNPQSVEDAEVCGQMFGSLGDSMLSLWSAVSGGNDWMTYGEPLRKISTWAFSLFVFYISFSTVGLFNVVTGVFVDGAVCCRTGDEEVQNYLEDLRNTTDEIKDFFKEADVDGSGILNLSEFKSLMRRPRAKAYFSGLNIDPEEAGVLFTILDEDQSNGILIDEFVNGTMKLKGAASKLDLVTLMYDLSRQTRRFDCLCEMLERELTAIKERLPDQMPPSQVEGKEPMPQSEAEAMQNGGLNAVGFASVLLQLSPRSHA